MSDTPRTDAETFREIVCSGPDGDEEREFVSADFARTLERELTATKAEVEALREALTDMHAGWQYIRSFHGDLYGVGWDRCDEKARAALIKDKA
jgi:hypothetical protein